MPGLVNHGRSSRFTIKALRSHQQHFKLSLCCEEKELGTVRSESWKVGLRQDFSASVPWTFRAWWVLVARGCPVHYRHATAFLVSTHHIPQSKMSPDPAVCPLRVGCVCVQNFPVSRTSSLKGTRGHSSLDWVVPVDRGTLDEFEEEF